MKKLLLFACAALLFSCSSDDDSSSTPNNNNNTSGVAYVRGSMYNAAFDYTFNNTATDTYLYNATSGFSGLGFDRWYYYGGALSSFTPPNFDPTFYISWNNMYFGLNGDESGETAAFYDTVSNLPSNFLTAEQDEAHNPGLEIAFESEDDVVYTTKDGSQSGSALSITGSSQAMINGLQTKTVWGTFSCKLYNSDDPTDVVNVTNGTFKIILSEFN